MPAIPAWPPKSTPRLFVESELAEGQELWLETGQARYLTTVMRRGTGDPVRLFDDRTGEWLGEIVAARRSACTIAVREKLGGREQVPDLWLCAAPLQKDNFALVAEKACELGVRRFVPTMMARCQVRSLNPERLHKRMVEAAEQCERTALPDLAETLDMADLLADWPADGALFFCDEEGGDPAATAFAAHTGPAAILIGPEGGFAPEERAAILAHPQARAISLGPRILRAETAAMAAIALWMGTAGDW